jgi:hypothetical protein
VLSIVAVFARLIWGAELREVEAQVLDFLGVPHAVRYILIGGLLALSWHYAWAPENADAAAGRRPWVRKSVVIASLAVVSLASLILIVDVWR